MLIINFSKVHLLFFIIQQKKCKKRAGNRRGKKRRHGSAEDEANEVRVSGTSPARHRR